MTLVLTVLAAVTATVVWYASPHARRLKIGLLCWMFWGASLMWLVDAFFEYKELQAAYFTPTLRDLLNDAYLGLSVIALALTVWTVIILVKDPDGVVKEALNKG